MALTNPVLTLKTLNDIGAKVENNLASVEDYEALDFFISAIGGNPGFIKNALYQNGFRDFNQYIQERKENSEDKRVSIGRVHGTILGTLSFLKSYAIQNNFYV